MRGIVRVATLGALGAGAIRLLRAQRARREISFLGRSVVITGGSRGIGLVMARQLADEGAKLTIFARDADEVARAEQELRERGADVLAFTADWREKVEAQGAIDRAIEHWGRVDVVINNAGTITAGPIEHMQDEDYDNALRSHFWGPLYTMQAVIPHMREQGGGRIVNISSIGGRIAVPHMVPYSASKFALIGLSDGFRAELAKDNIQVTTVAPGLIRSGSPPNTFQKGQHAKEYAWFSLSDSIPLISKDVDATARQIIEACRYGDPELTISTQARFLAIANVLFPDLTARALALAVRFLPSPTDDRSGDQARVGWDNQSAVSPSVLTTFGDRETVENNELMGRDGIGTHDTRELGS